MGQIEDLRLFTTIVDNGSIARAATQIGIAKSAVSRRLHQLEVKYDVKLINRSPGKWEITPAGQELYQRALPVITDAADLESDFIHSARSLNGPLRVTIAREFGMAFLKPILFDFTRKYPNIELS
ncbi:MAG: LysR family transcriptional regulator, partial [Cohaesibacter sp.]|nr:LysR family transcriptional regulator [Cohaesibacter sp.]